MGHDGEGTIYIPLEDFWAFVAKYAPGDGSAEIAYGVPRVTKGGSDLEIDYAFSTDTAPGEWSKKPDCLKQWDRLDSGGSPSAAREGE